jgi:translation initiation factor 1
MGLFAGTQWDIPAHCDRCGKLESDCQCVPEQPQRKPPSQQTLGVRTEKRKAGRVVTIVSGFEEGFPVQNQQLLTELKNVCGAGGTQEDGEMILQGDQKIRVTRHLEQLGYRVKR